MTDDLAEPTDGHARPVTSAPAVPLRRRLEPSTALPRWMIAVVAVPVVVFIAGAPIWFATDIGDITSDRVGTRRVVGIESNVTNWGIAASLGIALAIGSVMIGAWEWSRRRRGPVELVADGTGIWLLGEDGSVVASTGLAGASTVTARADRLGTKITAGATEIASPHLLHGDDAPELRATIEASGRTFVWDGPEARPRISPLIWPLFPRALRGIPRIALGVVAALAVVVIVSTQELSSGFLDPDVDVGPIDVDVDIEAPNFGNRPSEIIALGETGTVGDWSFTLATVDRDGGARTGVAAPEGTTFLYVELDATNGGAAPAGVFPNTVIAVAADLRADWSGSPCGELDTPSFILDEVAPGDTLRLPLCFAVPTEVLESLTIDVGGTAAGGTVALAID